MKSTNRALTKMRASWGGDRRSAHFFRIAVLAGVGLILTGGIVAQGQWNPRRPNGNRGVGKPPVVNRAAASVDPAMLELLKKIFHHTMDFSGVQRSQTGAKISEQKVTGNIQGHVRMEFMAPPEIRGDIMLIAPNSYYHYHARENRTDIAFWPVGREAKQQEIVRLVKRGLMTVAVTGQDTIAGRPCDIVTLSSRRPGAQAETQRRLWVDTESGIVMRNERWSARGQISASYMISIKIGPDASVIPGDFNPGLLPRSAKSEPRFPEDQANFATVAQAEAQAGFHILEPGQLPANYTLDGAWVFGQGKGTSVLLRYTHGVNHFSLFERVDYKVTPEQLSRPYRHGAANVQRWVAPVANGAPIQMLYIGHLSANEVQSIHDTTR